MHDELCLWRAVDDLDGCPMCRFIGKVRADERHSVLQEVKDRLSVLPLAQVIRHTSTRQILATVDFDIDRVIARLRRD